MTAKLRWLPAVPVVFAACAQALLADGAAVVLMGRRHDAVKAGRVPGAA
ncbi:hypothetical protein [Pseudomonas sp. 30_B]|nr:hypothetical protein [Pseudomonas sp. 30_B]